MVATNEFEEAWLDEGINSYTEVKVMDALYGKNSFMNYPFAQMSEDQAQRTMYLSDPDHDPISRFAYKFYSSGSYGAVTYGKTATMLLTLEKVIGEDTCRRRCIPTSCATASRIRPARISSRRWRKFPGATCTGIFRRRCTARR